MFWLISKLLVPLSCATFWIICGAALVVFIKKAKVKQHITCGVLAALLFFTNQGIIRTLISWWEIKPVHLEKENVSYRYGIVLGGFDSFNPEDSTVEFNASADRLCSAIMLYKQGKIQKIVISGGEGGIIKTGMTEAEVTRRYLLSIKIDSADIIIEPNSRNTVENATFVKQVLRPRDSECLLITSALHMRRSLAIFHKLGMHPRPYTCDMKGSYILWADFIAFKPDALVNWDVYVHEVLGFVIYKITGYC